MHTISILTTAFALLAVTLLVGHFAGGADGLRKATLVFLALWLIGASINMYVGVAQAGYTVTQEAPIFLFVFGVPAAVALIVRWKLANTHY